MALNFNVRIKYKTYVYELTPYLFQLYLLNLKGRRMSISEIYDIYLQYPSVVTDTRKLKEGDFFFALKGPNFNANTFAF